MDYPLFKRCSSTDSLFISYATNCFKIFRYISTGIWYSADTRKFMGSDPNVVNLSPKALIFQGYRALFFFKKFLIFFLKKTWQKPPKVRSLCDLLIKGNVVAATNLITLRRYVLWIEPTYAKISFNPLRSISQPQKNWNLIVRKIILFANESFLFFK